MTDKEMYWATVWQEILSDYGVNVDVDDGENDDIGKAFARCSDSEYDYTPPVNGESELNILRARIIELENREPCPSCGGRGGNSVAVGTNHTSWNDCNHCNGKKWI